MKTIDCKLTSSCYNSVTTLERAARGTIKSGVEEVRVGVCIDRSRLQPPHGPKEPGDAGEKKDLIVGRGIEFSKDSWKTAVVHVR